MDTLRFVTFNYKSLDINEYIFFYRKPPKRAPPEKGCPRKIEFLFYKQLYN